MLPEPRYYFCLALAESLHIMLNLDYKHMAKILRQSCMYIRSENTGLETVLRLIFKTVLNTVSIPSRRLSWDCLDTLWHGLKTVLKTHCRMVLIPRGGQSQDYTGKGLETILETLYNTVLRPYPLTRQFQAACKRKIHGQYVVVQFYSS